MPPLKRATSPNGLPSPWVFKLHRRYRQAIDEYHHVDGFAGVRVRVMHLPGQAEAVFVEVGDGLRVQRVVSRPVKQRQVGMVDVQAFF